MIKMIQTLMPAMTSLLLLSQAAKGGLITEDVVGELTRYEYRTLFDFRWCEEHLQAEGAGWMCEIGGYHEDSELTGGKVGRVMYDVHFLKTSEHCNTSTEAHADGYKLQALDYDHAGAISKDEAVICLEEARHKLPVQAVTTVDRLSSARVKFPRPAVEIGPVGQAVRVTFNYNSQWGQRNLKIAEGTWQEEHMGAVSTNRSGFLSLANSSSSTDMINFQDTPLISNGELSPFDCYSFFGVTLQKADGGVCNSVNCEGRILFYGQVEAGQRWADPKDARLPTEQEMRSCLDSRFHDGQTMMAMVLRYSE
ncbi:MAG: hypothetical protein C5B49_00505 [Bdellovibrio sp.]|nr:MAG: hypothetical protein C5B49_00505 [Bdellovibrio sp.]